MYPLWAHETLETLRALKRKDHDTQRRFHIHVSYGCINSALSLDSIPDDMMSFPDTWRQHRLVMANMPSHVILEANLALLHTCLVNRMPPDAGVLDSDRYEERHFQATVFRFRLDQETTGDRFYTYYEPENAEDSSAWGKSLVSCIVKPLSTLSQGERREYLEKLDGTARSVCQRGWQAYTGRVEILGIYGSSRPAIQPWCLQASNGELICRRRARSSTSWGIYSNWRSGVARARTSS